MRHAVLLVLATLLGAADAPWFGTLQHDPARLATLRSGGVGATVLELAWGSWQPTMGGRDTAYITQVRQRLAAMRAGDLAVTLDLGFQYPPAWIFDLPNSRYRNQYDVDYADPAPGMNGVNAVFNAALRTLQAAYCADVFATLGHDFTLIRLGWGWYAELNYPKAAHAGRTNCFWGFDDLAQGRVPGLPPGIPPCPVPGWRPGETSPDHDAARRFANWYLDALRDYHDWQIVTVRALHPGRLAMLYPSWGLRPGQLDAAVARDLDGSQVAQHGDLSLGEYWPRLVGGIHDPGVVVYSTWLDAPFGDDRSPDPAQWCPMRYLASLAEPRGLAVAGENTGGNDAAAMRRCFARAKELHLLGFFWAFEHELFDGATGHATMADFASGIAAQRSAGH
jgi:hypothetical protein